MSELFVIDCRDISTEDEFWQSYLDAVQPAGSDIFGRNRDAFWDAIEKQGPGDPGAGDFHFTNSAALRPLRNGDFMAALEQIAAEITVRRIAFS